MGIASVFRSADFSPHECRLSSCGLKSALRASARRFADWLLVLFALFVLLPAQSRAADPHWADERPAGPFHCHAEFRLDAYQGLLDDLAGVQADLVHTLGVEPSRELVELYLFNDATSYTRYLNARYPNVPYRRALYVKDNGPGEVFTHLGHDFQIDLRHESTHALLHGSLPMVPLWLDEGLAKYFEVPRDQRANGSPYLSTVRWNARMGTIPRLATLEQKRDLREMGAAEYRYSWAWVHFMLHGPPEARDELVHYLADIRAHNPPGQLSERLARRIPDLDGRIAKHFR